MKLPSRCQRCPVTPPQTDCFSSADKKGDRRCRGLLRELRILKKRYLYFLFFASQVKNTGTKMVAMNVAAIMPPKTPVPIECRA